MINANNLGGEYLCAHHLLIAHARAYHIYKDRYFKDQRGKIGITLNSRYFFKKNPTDSDEIVERAIQYRVSF
jgi:hypothetical protein